MVWARKGLRGWWACRWHQEQTAPRRTAQRRLQATHSSSSNAECPLLSQVPSTRPACHTCSSRGTQITQAWGAPYFKYSQKPMPLAACKPQSQALYVFQYSITFCNTMRPLCWDQAKYSNFYWCPWTAIIMNAVGHWLPNWILQLGEVSTEQYFRTGDTCRNHVLVWRPIWARGHPELECHEPAGKPLACVLLLCSCSTEHRTQDMARRLQECWGCTTGHSLLTTWTSYHPSDKSFHARSNP